MLGPVATVVVVDLAADFVDEGINLTGDDLAIVLVTGRVLVLLLAGWTWRICMALVTTALNTTKLSKDGVNASLVHVLAGLAAIMLVTVAILTGMFDLGVDAIPLLGGFGVGGLGGRAGHAPYDGKPHQRDHSFHR